MSDAVKVERLGAILEVSIDRPNANAIDAATSRELGEIFCDFRDDPQLRVAVLTGAGDRFFCGGWDLKAAAAGEAYASDYGKGGFGGLAELHDLHKPVVAAVNGMAVGGGFELALCADLVVAAEHAEFWLPETGVGVIADAACFRLPRQLPRAVALELLLTGRRISADDAARWGLVNSVVRLGALMDEARQLARTLADGAPMAIQATKAVIAATEGKTLAECYALLRSGEIPAYDAMLESEDAKEGPRAFAEKRDPVWRGK